MTEEMRMESDSIGTMEVPKEAYYGVQALRAKQNFPITGQSLHPVFIRNLAKERRQRHRVIGMRWLFRQIRQKQL